MEKLKIAVVNYADIPDGGATAHRILMLARGLVLCGHEVHVVAPYKFVPGPLLDIINGVKVHWGASLTRQSAHSWLAKLRKRYLVFRTARQIAAAGLDWMILYDLGVDGIPFIPLARKYGVLLATDYSDLRCYSSDKPTLVELISIIKARIGHMFLTRRLQLNIAISRFLATYLRGIAPEVSVVIVPPPVDTRQYTNQEQAAKEFRGKFGINAAIVIGFFGSIWGVKGPKNLLKAAAILKSRGKEFKILMTGNVTGNAPLMQLIEELELKDRLVLPGFLPKDELINVMSAADIMVDPKSAHIANQAAFPQKLVEYLSLGKPIVAAAIGDACLYLRHGENALLCRAGDSEAMARQLEKLIDNAELRQKLGAEARETALRFFDCEIIARRLESALFEAQKKYRSL